MTPETSQWSEKAKANAKAIEWEIDKLSSGHWNLFKRQYRDFWAHAKQISSMFKELKPILKEDRERLWEKFSSVCEETKRKQQTGHENRQFKSQQHLKNILRKAENARPSTLFGFFPPDVEEMKALGQVLREASAMLSKHKQEMFGEHKQGCFSRIQEVREIHDIWWKELKRNRTKRHEEYQAKVRANLDRNYERHRKASDALQRLRNHADELRDKINSAWNDDFRDRAYGWLSETEDKIRDIEDSLQRIEEWIREDEDKLR